MAKYRIPIEETFSYQRPVIAVANDAQTAASKGDRYIVGATPAGEFSALATNDIVWYDGTAWQSDTPSEGWIAYNLEHSYFKVFDGTNWTEFEEGEGDMLKSVFATQLAAEGIVDKAAALDDNAGNSVTAAEVQDAVDKAHTQNSDTILDEGGVNETSAAEARDAADKAHTQNTDTKLDEGGLNEITAAEAKDAYDKRGQYDEDLGVIFMDFGE